MYGQELLPCEAVKLLTSMQGSVCVLHVVHVADMSTASHAFFLEHGNQVSQGGQYILKVFLWMEGKEEEGGMLFSNFCKDAM